MLPLSSSFLFFPFLFVSVVSSSTAYTISNANDFIKFASDVNSGTTYSGTTIYLTDDIDFSAYSGNFEPVGKVFDKDNFAGTFNGQGHLIKNLVVNSSDFMFTSLFGFSKGMIIKNLVVDESCSFSSSYTFGADKDPFVSSVVGYCYATSGSGKTCTIENIVNAADILYHSNSSQYILTGGIAGKCLFNSIINNCVNFGSVMVSSEGTAEYIYSCGIVGEISGGSGVNVLIKNCINYGSITNNMQATVYVSIGGITGIVWSYDNIENCLSVGHLSSIEISDGDLFIGSISGSIREGSNTFTNCFWAESVGNYNMSGEILDASYATITNVSLMEMDYNSIRTLYNVMGADGSSNMIVVHLNGGRIENVSPYDILILNKNYVPVPVKEEHVFNNWCTDTGCSDTCNSIEMGKCNSKDVYANWTANKYTVTIDFDNGTEAEERTFEFNAVIDFPDDPTKEGYSFIDWNDTTTTMMPAYNLIIKALWIPNNYTVTFDFDNGTESEQRLFTYDAEIIYPVNPMKEGHSFINWNDTSITTMPAHNLSIKALWVINKYTVTFNTTGGTASSPLKREITYGEQYGEFPETIRAGYTLAGWFTEENGNGGNIDFDTNVTISNNHTLYAYWTINNYTVTFDFDNGIEPEIRSFEYNSDITYPDDPTKEGCAFLGWDNNVTKMPAYNLVVKAKWVNTTSLTSTVEIVFSTVDLTDDEVEKIVNEFASNNNYEIVEISRDSDGEIVVIVKFNDADDASVFVREISAPTNKNNYITKIGFVKDKHGSFSFSFVPLISFIVFMNVLAL